MDERALPWIRLAGALIVGFALIEGVTSTWIHVLFEHMHQAGLDATLADGMSPFEDPQRALRSLQLVSGADQGTRVLGGWTIASTLLVAAWRTRRLRLPAGLTALAFVATTASSLRFVTARFAEAPYEVDAFTEWYRIHTIAETLVWGGVLALVLVHSRDRPRRRAALGCMAVAAATVGLRLYGTFVVRDGMPPSWWPEPLLSMHVSTAIALLGSLGLGVGLWLTSGPVGEVEVQRFDAAAARGLRLARSALWWRVGLAMGGVGLAIAGTMAMQRAQQSMMFGGSPGGSPIPWTLKVAPWLGYLELGLAALTVVGMAAAVLQRRSMLAAALSGVGTVLLLAASAGSFALNVAMHEAVHLQARGAGRSLWGGDELVRYGELAVEHEPILRGLGLAGMACTLVGLIVLVRVTGHASPKRGIRFLALAALFTTTWLYGREALGWLGSGVLLLAPVMLGAAIWMLLDLTTFLGEVADGLGADDPAPTPPAPRLHRPGTSP